MLKHTAAGGGGGGGGLKIDALRLLPMPFLV